MTEASQKAGDPATPKPNRTARRALTVRVEHGPELLYVQRDGGTAHWLSREGGVQTLDPLDRRYLQALCLHVLHQLDPDSGGPSGPDGERHPVTLTPNVITAPGGDWR